ncbi:hypothetical protein [Kribbella solani]|uniref:hypothetical protein n=1 Tax=Kribbella solani TaxID=236067 RepID=UPI0029AC401E|nr:hypothetical protein [Kribbella solani]MDX2969594.1 hypothetical protein [Kribbella solani]
MGNETSWREERRQAATEHAAALERKKAAETARARELLRDFIAALKERGVAPEPLRAQVIGSNASYRTELVGWYLRRNRSLAVDVDGNFYILGVPASLKARVTGARVEASDPPLVVGQGARDGESMPLAELLQLRLDS